jgi:HAD superfamily hydrolase (TIGR01549 family)
MSLDSKRIKGLCFDVDGTLADTDDQFVEILAGWLRPINALPAGLRQLLAGTAGSQDKKAAILVARRLVMAMESPANMLFGLPDRLHLDQPMLRANEWLREVTTRGSPRQPHAAAFKIITGVHEMLAHLHAYYPLSVVSARGERSTLRFLEQFNLTGYFTCIATAQTCRHTKPYPDPILWAAEKMGLKPEECLMIGDTTVDIQAGRAAGAQTLGVLCGFGTANELQACGADAIIPQTPSLLDLISF